MKSCSHSLGLENDTFNILFVDDDPSYLRLIKAFIDTTPENRDKYIGYAESAEQALTELRERSFHLIFTDFIMPKMSGIELAREVRNLVSEIPIIMVTGSPISSEITTDAMSAGISKIMAKPLNLKLLRETIREEERKLKGCGLS